MRRQRSSWKRPPLFPLHRAAGSSRAFGEKPCGQAPCKRGGRDAAIIGRCNRGPHGLDLLLHQPIDLLLQFLVDRSAGKGFRTGKQERPGIRAGQRDAQRTDCCPGCRERDSHAGQWKVDGAAYPHFFIGGCMRRCRQMHRRDELAGGQSEMGLAVFDIEFTQRNTPLALRAGNVDFGAEHEQGRRQVAGESGMTALSLWGNVTDISAIFQTIGVGAPPPFALIVINAAGIEAQIAANGCHDAVTGPGDRFGGLRERAILAGGCRVASQRGDGHTRADRHPAAVGLDLGQFIDAGEIDQQIRAADATPHVHEQVGATRDEAAARMLDTRRNRLFDGARLGQTELGQRCGHDAAFKVASFACRRRWMSASMTRSGVTGSSLRSIPMALAMALTKAGGKPAKAPSLASLAPNGPYGSWLSTICTSIGVDSAMVGMRYSSRLACAGRPSREWVSSHSACPIPIQTDPWICSSTASGLMAWPQSSATHTLSTVTRPVASSMLTSTTWAA